MKVSSKVIGWEFCLWCSLWLFSGRRKTKTECRDLDWLPYMAVKAKEACLAKHQEFHLWHLDKHTVALNASIRRDTIQMKLCMLTSTSKCGVGRVLVLQFSAWRCWNYFLTMQWILWKIIQFQCFRFDHQVFVPVLTDWLIDLLIYWLKVNNTAATNDIIVEASRIILTARGSRDPNFGIQVFVFPHQKLAAKVEDRITSLMVNSRRE